MPLALVYRSQVSLVTAGVFRLFLYASVLVRCWIEKKNVSLSCYEFDSGSAFRRMPCRHVASLFERGVTSGSRTRGYPYGMGTTPELPGLHRLLNIPVNAHPSPGPVRYFMQYRNSYKYLFQAHQPKVVAVVFV